MLFLLPGQKGQVEKREIQFSNHVPLKKGSLLPKHFHKGVELCDRFLTRFGRELEGSEAHQHIVNIRCSFQGGLGEQEETVPEHDEDAFEGGD